MGPTETAWHWPTATCTAARQCRRSGALLLLLLPLLVLLPLALLLLLLQLLLLAEIAY